MADSMVVVEYITLQLGPNIMKNVEYITVVSNEHHTLIYCRRSLYSFLWHVLSPRKLTFCLNNSLFTLTTKKVSKVCITGHSSGEFTGNQWIPLTKCQWRRKHFHVIMSSWFYSCILNVMNYCQYSSALCLCTHCGQTACFTVGEVNPCTYLCLQGWVVAHKSQLLIFWGCQSNCKENSMRWWGQAVVITS